MKRRHNTPPWPSVPPPINPHHHGRDDDSAALSAASSRSQLVDTFATLPVSRDTLRRQKINVARTHGMGIAGWGTRVRT